MWMLLLIKTVNEVFYASKVGKPEPPGTDVMIKKNIFGENLVKILAFFSSTYC
jgi:hypothetical protein